MHTSLSGPQPICTQRPGGKAAGDRTLSLQTSIAIASFTKSEKVECAHEKQVKMSQVSYLAVNSMMRVSLDSPSQA